MHSKLLLLFTILLLCGCSRTSTKILRFEQKKDKVTHTEKLSGYLAKNKNPKVVLRVPYAATSDVYEKNLYLYNAIESQLFSNGFQVRDRELFNNIIDNEDVVDYSKLKDKSDTDIIIELTKIDPSVIYKTNQYYNTKNEPIPVNYTFKDYGAEVEFKIILISTNELAGIYNFSYTPCANGCVVERSIGHYKFEDDYMKKKGITPFESVEEKEMEEFMKAATQKLINKMRS